MITRQLINGEYTIGLDFVTDNEAIRLIILDKLNTFKGEYWLDADSGIDYIQTNAKINVNDIILDIQEAVQDTDGVVRIVSFNYTLENRKLEIDMEIETIYTENLTISEVLA